MAASGIGGVSNLDPNTIFEILTVLGEGSYGTVYKAIDLRDSSIVAVKVIGIEAGENWQSLKHEVDILKECKNEYIVAYRGVFEDSNQYLWIVMEYCDAGSVLDLMSICNKRALEEDVIAVILQMCLKALDYLHKQKKIHRDIKSGNLLLTHRGSCKLADFGVSAELGSTVSKRKTLIGTPYWMAPEVLKEDLYDSKADIWSLAITAIEMATGDPPLVDIHPMKVIFQIPSLPPPTLPNVEQWSPEFHEFLAVCLQKDPTKRPSAEQLLSTNAFIRGAKSQALIAELVQASMEEIDQYRSDSDLTTLGSDLESRIVVSLTESKIEVNLGTESKFEANTANTLSQEVKHDTLATPRSRQEPSLVHMGSVREIVVANQCKAVQSDFTRNEQLLRRGKCKACGQPPSKHSGEEATGPVNIQVTQQQFLQKHLKQLEDKYKGQAQRQEAEAQRQSRLQHEEQMRQLELLKQKYLKAAEGPKLSLAQQQAREHQLEQLKQKYVALGAQSK